MGAAQQPLPVQVGDIAPDRRLGDLKQLGQLGGADTPAGGDDIEDARATLLGEGVAAERRIDGGAGAGPVRADAGTVLDPYVTPVSGHHDRPSPRPGRR